MIIEKINKKKNNYTVTFTDGTKITLKEDIIIKYNLLKPKKEISDDLFQEINIENEYFTGIDKAYDFLAKMATEKETRIYLEKYYEKSLVDRIIKNLYDLHLLDDKKYALEYLNYAMKNRYGKEKIKCNLEKKGISDSNISYALHFIDSKDYYNNLEYEIEKYLKNAKPGSKTEVKRKIISSMKSKGYETDYILLYLEKKPHLLDNISRDDLFIEKDYDKIKTKLQKKHLEKNVFDEKVIAYLAQKGYSYSDIKKLLEKRKQND